MDLLDLPLFNHAMEKLTAMFLDNGKPVLLRERGMDSPVTRTVALNYLEAALRAGQCVDISTNDVTQWDGWLVIFQPDNEIQILTTYERNIIRIGEGTTGNSREGNIREGMREHEVPHLTCELVA